MTEFGQEGSDYADYSIEAVAREPSYMAATNTAAVNLDQIAGILTLGPFTDRSETIVVVVTVSNTF